MFVNGFPKTKTQKPNVQHLPVSYWGWSQANHLMSTGSQNSWKCNVWLPCPGKCQLQHAPSHCGVRLVRFQEISTFQFTLLSTRMLPGEWLGSVEQDMTESAWLMWYTGHVTSPGYWGLCDPCCLLKEEKHKRDFKEVSEPTVSLPSLAIQQWWELEKWVVRKATTTY